MCEEHIIAKGTVHAFIKQKSAFSFKEVQNEIIRRNGILRVSTGVTVGEYLRDLEGLGIIEYQPLNEIFNVKIR